MRTAVDFLVCMPRKYHGILSFLDLLYSKLFQCSHADCSRLARGWGGLQDAGFKGKARAGMPSRLSAMSVCVLLPDYCSLEA